MGRAGSWNPALSSESVRSPCLTHCRADLEPTSGCPGRPRARGLRLARLRVPKGGDAVLVAEVLLPRTLLAGNMTSTVRNKQKRMAVLAIRAVPGGGASPGVACVSIPVARFSCTLRMRLGLPGALSTGPGLEALVRAWLSAWSAGRMKISSTRLARAFEGAGLCCLGVLLPALFVSSGGKLAVVSCLRSQLNSRSMALGCVAVLAIRVVLRVPSLVGLRCDPVWWLRVLVRPSVSGCGCLAGICGEVGSESLRFALGLYGSLVPLFFLRFLAGCLA